jgi:hypothetical protein
MPGNSREIITTTERRPSLLTSIGTRSANKMLMPLRLALQRWRFANELQSTIAAGAVNDGVAWPRPDAATSKRPATAIGST